MPLRPATGPLATASRLRLHLSPPSFVPSSRHSHPQERPYSSRPRVPGGPPNYETEQAIPLGPYYQTILIRPQPVPDVKPEEPPSTSQNSPKRETSEGTEDGGEDRSTSATTLPSSSGHTSRLSAEPATPEEKARIVFGSRLAGPKDRAERLAALRDRGTTIAGVRVPPRPQEPDNCCMSGCVNCVWDRFRDDMEEWASASARAEAAMQEQRAQGSPQVLGSASAVKGMPSPQVSPASASSTSPSMATTMDDDGGGSDSNWGPDPLSDTGPPKIAKDLWEDDLYKNVPVGIREFMKQEKRLKEKHAQDGTFGA